jgi:hypothetical protein
MYLFSILAVVQVPCTVGVLAPRQAGGIVTVQPVGKQD